MKKNLLKLLALPLVMGLFVGCSDSDSEDGDNNNTEPSNPVCVYIPSGESTTPVGVDINVTGTAMLDGVAITVDTNSSAYDVSQEGNFTITYSATECPNPTAELFVTVANPTIPEGDVTAENILPF